ncbi:MAG: Ig-like domain-containing protein, partial [Eubacterium sp.]|nr:Ig-like domain-containing protein [Eubacterium sp.]
FKFQNGSYYLGRNNASLQISQTNPNNSWNWDGTNNRLSIVNNTRTYYLRYNNNTFSLNTATNSVYLYKEVKVSYEVDPYGVTSIQVIPDSMELYKGNEADAVATVSPLTAEDRTVTWSSGNEAVATVDSYGHIVAVGAGTTEITATSNSNPAVEASCTVTVVSVSKQLNGIIWDEEGGVYFSNFNVSSLPTWNKLHDDNKNLPLQSAFMQSATQLYAATMDVDAMTTMLYSVNRNSYALTEYGENFVLAMDTARASTRYTGYYVYAFGSFLIFGNIAPEDDGEGGYYSGLPYGVLDLGETTGDDTYIAGVAARSIGTTSSSFYFLDENGTIWQTTFRIGSSVTFGNPTKVVDTGISTNFLYQTLYYDGTYLYWGHTDDNSAELIIINPNTKAVYHAGDFGEGVWPVTGFYVNGSVAPSSVEDGTVEAQDLSGLKPVATRAELMTEAVMNRFAAEVAKKSAKSIPAGKLPEVPAEEPVAEGSAETVIPDDEPAEPAQQTEETVAETAEESVEVQEPEETAVPEDPAADPEEEVEQILEEESSEDGENAEADEVQNPVTGGTNAFAKGRRTPAKNFIRDSVTVMPSSVIPGGEETDSSRTASITEATSVTNGLYEITYDPDSVTVSAGDSALTYTSFNDDGEGKILFAFARDPHTAEGEAILNITFAAVDCEGQSEITAKTTEAGTRFDHENGVETETFHVAPINHDFGTPEYSWTDDYLNCTATAVCSRNSAHVLTETVSATFEVTKPATCESAGETTYTATFTNSAFETQTRTIANIDAIGHDYTLTKWTWSADGTSATATFTCSRDSGHQQVIPATMTVEQTDATCTEPGYVTYTATVEFEGKTYTDDASDLIPALGHDWNAPSFTWADDHSSATATFTCSRDAEHVQAVPAEVTSAVDPETGAMTFTATVVFEGTTYTESKTLEAYLTLEESFVETVIKATEQLHAASNMPITWTVEAGGEKILSVDENGLVTAKYPGTAKVTASILDGSISVSCDFKVEFIDVTKEADYFYTPVYWAVENGITTGFTDSNGDLTGYFKPGDTCTRGQIVTFLWRSKGSPKVTATVLERFDIARTHGHDSFPEDFLSGNSLIEEAIARYYESGSEESLLGVLDAILCRADADGHFLIPVMPPQAMYDAIDIDKLRVGDTVSSPEQPEFQLLCIQTKDGKQWPVVFTSREELQKGEIVSVVSNFIDSTLEGFADMAEEGVVINPWGQSFLLTKDMIKLILQVRKERNKS